MVLPFNALTKKGVAHLMQDIILTIKIGDMLLGLPLFFYLKVVKCNRLTTNNSGELKSPTKVGKG
jgi:hypothetical protein